MITALHHPRAGYHLLRLSVAAMMLLHGIAKLIGGIGGIETRVAGVGLPRFVAWGVLVGEVLAPLLVIANVFVQPAAIVMAINMVFAIWLVHAHELLALGRGGGWAIELQALYLAASLSLALIARPGRRG